MTRLVTLVALGLALTFAPPLGEAQSQRIHVTAEIGQQTFTGTFAKPKLGDQLITNVELFDASHEKVGMGAGVCTIVSVPPQDTLLQCLLTAVLPQGQIIFGGIAPLPEVGVVAQLGIVGGTDDFHHARGEATLVVLTDKLQDATFDLE